MCDYYIDLVIAALYIVRALKKLGLCRNFIARPIGYIKAHIYIRAFSAAHYKKFQTLDVENLTAHKVVDAPADIVHLAAVPFRNRASVEQLKVLMRSVNKTDVILPFCQLFEKLLFFLFAAPDKTEVTADN